MTSALSNLDERIAKLEAAAEDCRAATREAHEATQELREAEKSIRDLLQIEPVELLEAKFQAVAEDQIGQMTTAVTAAQKEAVKRVGITFERLARIYLGADRGGSMPERLGVEKIQVDRMLADIRAAAQAAEEG